MYSFKDFGIKTDTHSFSGDKIKIDRILNNAVIVEDYKIEPSKFTEKGLKDRLCLQIQHNGTQRIIFTSSTVLIQMIQQIPKDKFPFETTIIKENERYKFT